MLKFSWIYFIEAKKKIINKDKFYYESIKKYCKLMNSIKILENSN
jgi:hypothetical protein